MRPRLVRSSLSAAALAPGLVAAAACATRGPSPRRPPRWPGPTVSCNTQAAATARAEAEALGHCGSPPETTAADSDEHEAAVKPRELEAAKCAYYAAHCLARAGNVSGALNYPAIAAGHPAMNDQAERLRASLPVPR